MRTFLDGDLVGDTTRPLLVWEIPYFPTYYLPLADLVEGTLVESGLRSHSPSRGDATRYDVKTKGATATGAALVYADSPIEELRSAVRLDFEAMSAWFEEDEQIYVHPRDPYKRVDALQSSRHVEVRVGGVTVADSPRPVLLFETGLPVRHYLPKTDVKMELLTPSPTTTRCPYKGMAEYYSVTVGDQAHEDLAWWYRYPTPESSRVAGLVCFYNEKVDVVLDGVLQDRPVTQFA